MAADTSVIDWLLEGDPAIRWHYDVLRGLDHLRAAGAPRDQRLGEAIELVRSRQKADGRWPLNAGYGGIEPIVMERAGEPSRWITLRCLRVLDWWKRGAAS
jgi:hypothetical protein